MMIEIAKYSAGLNITLALATTLSLASTTFASQDTSIDLVAYDCAAQNPQIVNVGDEYVCLYEEDLFDPYKQWWNIDYLFSRGVESGRHVIYLHGDGKSGDFFGTLEISCFTKSVSWIAADGWIPIEQVPTEVYRRLGLAYCGDEISLIGIEALWD